MGEALISRRGNLEQLVAENLKDHYVTSSASSDFTGFDFKNNSYFIRLCYMQGSTYARYIYDFIVEKGGKIINISSVKADGDYKDVYTESYEFLDSVTIDVKQGTLSVDRASATYLLKHSECVCVVLS